MKYTHFFAAFLALILGSNKIHADQEACVATRIYYVNGVWNTAADAYNTMKIIESAYKGRAETLYPEQSFEFDFSYNYSAGYVRDIIETIGQKLAEIDDEKARQQAAEQYFMLFNKVKKLWDLYYDSSSEVLKNELGSAIGELIAGRITDTIDTANMINEYKMHLKKQKRILLISHSQGNLFANQAIAALMSEYGDSIGMIGVASPAAKTYNSSPYFTATDDWIINELRNSFTVLPGNINNYPESIDDPRDIANHGFYPSYFFEGLNSRTKIDREFYLYLESLQPPNSETGSSCLEVWEMQDPSLTIDGQGVKQSTTYYTETTGYSDWQDPKDFAYSSNDSSESNIDVFIPDATFLNPSDNRTVRPIRMPPICLYDDQIIPNRIIVSDEWDTNKTTTGGLIKEYTTVYGEMDLDMYGKLNTVIVTTNTFISNYDVGCEVGDTISVIVCQSTAESYSEHKETIDFDFLTGVGNSEVNNYSLSENSALYYGGGRIINNVTSVTTGEADWVAQSAIYTDWSILNKHWKKFYIQLASDNLERENQIREYCEIDKDVLIPNLN